MKKNGFTLVEMIGVITLLALLTIFALPPIINQINKKKESMKEALKQTVFAASRIYADNNKSLFSDKTKTYCISLQKMVDLDYLDKSIFTTNSSGYKETDMVKLSYTTYDYVFDIVSSCVEG